jgi:protein phosphatase PTC7
VGLHLIPHDDKLDKGGEDTWFISEDLQTMGVFDGVGGWSDVNVDPRDYSLSLSKHCKLAVDEKALTNPLQILRYGYDLSQSITGSSTACIINISGNQFLSANLGDSGFRIIRRSQVVYESTSQQHRFNMPYQIGPQSDDKPEDADIRQFTLETGDYIILGTDGLFDNLYDKDIIQVIENLPESVSMETVATEIAIKAYEISKLPEVKIPFNDMALKFNGMSIWDNGKQDDITVIVARYKG